VPSKTLTFIILAVIRVSVQRVNGVHFSSMRQILELHVEAMENRFHLCVRFSLPGIRTPDLGTRSAGFNSYAIEAVSKCDVMLQMVLIRERF